MDDPGFGLGHHFAFTLAFAWAILQTFWGYRLLRLTFAVSGFLVGFILGHEWATYLQEAFAWASWVPLLGALLCGLAGGAVAFGLLRVGVFLLGAWAGMTAIWLWAPTLQPPWPVVFLAGAGLVAGLVAVALLRPVVIGASALSGASLAVGLGVLWWHGLGIGLSPGETGSGLSALGQVLSGWQTLGLLVAVLGMAILGCVVQSRQSGP